MSLDGDALDPPGGSDVLDEAEAIGFDLLLAWITDGPPRPPESHAELLEWAREEGALPR